LLDPNWNQWPPESEYILTGGITLSVVSLQPSLNDYTYPSAFIPATQYLNTDQNTAPTITFDTVVPYPPLTVDATIEYNDNDNNLPVERMFIFDDMPYEMGSSDHYYGDGSFFESSIPWPGPEWHTFYFRFSDGDSIVETELDSIYLTMDGIEDENLPLSFELHQNYPNPFNARTVIEFQLSEHAVVNLAVYDIAGRKVADLGGDDYSAGVYTLIWDGTDNRGRYLSSGIYLYKMKAGNFVETRKMLLMK
jgi:hypothetical protein